MQRRHRDNARSPITNKNFMSFLFCHRNEHIIHLNSNLFELYKNKLNEKASDILTKGVFHQQILNKSGIEWINNLEKIHKLMTIF